MEAVGCQIVKNSFVGFQLPHPGFLVRVNRDLDHFELKRIDLHKNNAVGEFLLKILVYDIAVLTHSCLI